MAPLREIYIFKSSYVKIINNKRVVIIYIGESKTRDSLRAWQTNLYILYFLVPLSLCGNNLF